MKFEQLDIAGAYVVHQERRADSRGYFARLWCKDEYHKQGLVPEIAQVNTGFNPVCGTLRGMHYQLPPHDEVKIAGCTRGEVFDVMVDLRRNSQTYRRWFGMRLTPDTGSMLYIPAGCAHGYLTLQPDSELVYLTSKTYAAPSARGVRHDDPAFGIVWPQPPALISDADAAWPAFTDAAAVSLGSTPV